MSDYLFSFIGTGNMGGALARAAAKNVPADRLLLSDRNAELAEKLAGELQCSTGSSTDAAGKGRFVFLGVKPQMMRDLFAQIGSVLAQRSDRFVLVSMAAGVTMEQICAMAGTDYPVIRIMPNIPCAAGKGMILYDTNGLVTDDELSEFLSGMGR